MSAGRLDRKARRNDPHLVICDDCWPRKPAIAAKPGGYALPSENGFKVVVAIGAGAALLAFGWPSHPQVPPRRRGDCRRQPGPGDHLRQRITPTPPQAAARHSQPWRAWGGHPVPVPSAHGCRRGSQVELPVRMPRTVKVRKAVAQPMA